MPGVGSESASCCSSSSSAANAYKFTLSSGITVFTLDVSFNARPTSNLTPAIVRCGIAQGLATTQVPTLADPSGGAGGGAGWLLDSGGNPAYGDIAASAIASGGDTINFVLTTLGLTLTTGITYHVLVMHEATMGTPNTNGRVNSAGNGSVSGALANTPGMLQSNNNASAFGAWNNSSNVYGMFTLYTGTPAAPKASGVNVPLRRRRRSR